MDPEAATVDLDTVTMDPKTSTMPIDPKTTTQDVTTLLCNEVRVPLQHFAANGYLLFLMLLHMLPYCFLIT